MTYLGYQVRHLPNQIEELRAWLETHTDDAISMWGKPTIGQGIYYSTRTGQEVLDWLNESQIDEAKDLNYTETRCEFITEKEYFILEVVDFPTDRWGNVATCQSRLELVPGCYEIGYSNDSLFITYLPEEWEFEDDADKEEFLDFVDENAPTLIDTVGETSSYGEWYYYTTNKPFTDPEWQTVYQKYLEYKNQ